MNIRDSLTQAADALDVREASVVEAEKRLEERALQLDAREQEIVLLNQDVQNKKTELNFQEDAVAVKKQYLDKIEQLQSVEVQLKQKAIEQAKMQNDLAEIQRNQDVQDKALQTREEELTTRERDMEAKLKSQLVEGLTKLVN